jgi:amino acid transporter
MALPELAAPELSEASEGLVSGVQAALGPDLTAVFEIAIIVAITVCTLAVHSGTGRLIFAMARDNNLPFGRSLARVSHLTRTPVLPIVGSGLVAVAILLFFANFQKLNEIVTSVAILWANLAYLFVTVPLLYHRWKGWPPTSPAPSKFFSLAKWGLPLNLLAVCWGLFMVVNMGWPRPQIYGSEWYEQYSALALTVGLLLVGGAYYALVQRYKTGVLAEHRAGQ